MTSRLNLKLVLLVTAVITLTINFTGCAKAEFALGSLSITPGKVGAGNPATISFNVTNVGNADGVYKALLVVNGETAESRDVRVPAGSTETVNFIVKKETVGNYIITVGGLNKTLDVVKPAEFQVSSLTVTPTEVTLGQEVTVSASVYNSSDIEAIYACVLRVAGVPTQTIEFSISGRETETAVFTFKAEKTGLCQVEVGEQSKTIKVLKPAEFKMTDLVISPTTAIVKINNIGDVEGTYQVGLEIDGKGVDFKEGTVPANNIQTVTLNLGRLAPGIRNIVVRGQKIILIKMTGTVPTYNIEKFGELSQAITVAAKKILVDASKDGGTWWSPQVAPFDQEKSHQGKSISDYLRSLGYEVTELPRGYTVSLDLLQKYDFVIRDGVYLRSQSYTDDEIAAYQEFVKNGGKLLLFTPGLRSFERDPLAESFGLVFAGITNGTWGWPKIIDHSVFNGNKTPILNLGGSGLTSYPADARIIGWVTETAFLDTNDNSIKDGQETWGPPAIGEMVYGKGKIVFEGQFAARESLGFIGNVIDWFAASP